MASATVGHLQSQDKLCARFHYMSQCLCHKQASPPAGCRPPWSLPTLEHVVCRGTTLKMTYIISCVPLHPTCIPVVELISEGSTCRALSQTALGDLLISSL